MRKLTKVLVIARHGDRTPSVNISKEYQFWESTLAPPPFRSCSTIPNLRVDSDDDVQSYPFSRLTRLGCEQMTRLAQKLLLKYPSVFTNHDAPRMVYYSTDYERTYRSALEVADEIFKQRSDGVPIEIRWTQKQVDPLDPWESLEPFRAVVSDFVHKDPKYTYVSQQYEPLRKEIFQHLEPYFNHNLKSCTWIALYDLFRCKEAHPSGFELLTNGILQHYSLHVQEITTLLFVTLYSEIAIRKFAVGGLLGGILQWLFDSMDSVNSNDLVMDATLRIDPHANFSFVSCHDVNILPLKIALEWDDSKKNAAGVTSASATWPDYGDYLSFEVFDDDYVRIVDQNDVEKLMTKEALGQICVNHICNG